MPTKITLTQRQEAWLVRHFRNTKNAEIAEHLGISESSVHRFARELGLKKTGRFMKKCQAATSVAAKLSHLRNGTYPPKGYIIPGSEKYRFPKGGRPETAAQKRRRIEKARDARNASIKEDRLRIRWVLEPRTRLKLNPQPEKVRTQRFYLRKRGYYIARGSMTCYYDENTERSWKIENRRRDDPKYCAFRFVELPDNQKILSSIFGNRNK